MVFTKEDKSYTHVTKGKKDTEHKR